MPEWTIRQPTPDDAASLATLHIDVWRHAYRGLLEQELLDRLEVGRSTERWRRSIDRQGGASTGNALRAAFVGDQPIGIAEVGDARDQDAPCAIEVLSLNVAAQWHGKGVASALLDSTLGDRDAYLWVLRGNERAATFYRKHGFDFDGTERYDDDWRCFDERMHRVAKGE